MSSYLVLHASRYDFVAQSGDHLTGSKVTYADLVDSSQNAKGLAAMTVPASYEMFELLDNLPAFYDLDFRHKPDKQGKPVLTLTKAKFIKPLDVPEIALS
jgi:hypothetical protein